MEGLIGLCIRYPEKVTWTSFDEIYRNECIFVQNKTWTHCSRTFDATFERNFALVGEVKLEIYATFCWGNRRDAIIEEWFEFSKGRIFRLFEESLDFRWWKIKLMRVFSFQAHNSILSRLFLPDQQQNGRVSWKIQLSDEKNRWQKKFQYITSELKVQNYPYIFQANSHYCIIKLSDTAN